MPEPVLGFHAHFVHSVHFVHNGKLDWWSNGSGNYRPDSDHAEQAALPMERFFTYEQVLKDSNKQSRQQIAAT